MRYEHDVAQMTGPVLETFGANVAQLIGYIIVVTEKRLQPVSDLAIRRDLCNVLSQGQSPTCSTLVSRKALLRLECRSRSESTR